MALQKALDVAEQLPRPAHRVQFCARHERVSASYGLAVEAAHALLTTLLRHIEEESADDASSPATDRRDALWTRLERCQRRLRARRQQLLRDSERHFPKRKAISSATDEMAPLRVLDQSIEVQLQRALRAPESRQRLRALACARRTPYRPLGMPPEEAAGMRSDPEHYDDTDWYHGLLRQLIADANGAPGDARFRELLERPESADGGDANVPRSSTELLLERARRRVRKYAPEDRRVSKGRRLRYDVHEKLVGFLAPRAPPPPPAHTSLHEFSVL